MGFGQAAPFPTNALKRSKVLIQKESANSNRLCVGRGRLKIEKGFAWSVGSCPFWLWVWGFEPSGGFWGLGSRSLILVSVYSGQSYVDTGYGLESMAWMLGSSSCS